MLELINVEKVLVIIFPFSLFQKCSQNCELSLNILALIQWRIQEGSMGLDNPSPVPPLTV